MRLNHFAINDFQSYRTHQELRLDPHITILAGRNNVGKTSVLRAIRLPMELHQGTGSKLQLQYIWEWDLDELTQALPDFTSILRTVGISQASPRYVISATLAKEHPQGTASIASGASPWIGGLVITECSITDTALTLELLRTEQVRSSPSYRFAWRNLNPPASDEWNRFTRGYVELIKQSVSNSYYIHPKRPSTYSMPLAETSQIAADGSNLTNVVTTLFNNSNSDLFTKVQTFMRSAFPEITRIHPRISGEAPTTATLYVVYGNQPTELEVPLEYCGTGVEQMLILATAILTTDSARLFMIDEPHAFLHPTAERSLLQLIEEHPEHQYIIATHSAIFLNALALDHTRLITIDSTGSHINDVLHASEVLTELDVTAADLWSADAILWIEGTSDVKAVEALLPTMPELRTVNIRVLAMPDWIRSVSGSEKNASALVRFLETVQEAVLPFKVPSLYVFDMDEKPLELRERIEAATGGRCRFLPTRELENLLIVPEAVHQVLSELCLQVGVTPPALEEISAEIDELLADTDNREIYRNHPSGPDRAKVVGSMLLGKLWLKWASTSFQKVEYDPKLVRAVISVEPAALDPLRDLVSELADAVNTARTTK